MDGADEGHYGRVVKRREYRAAECVNTESRRRGGCDASSDGSVPLRLRVSVLISATQRLRSAVFNTETQRLRDMEA